MSLAPHEHPNMDRCIVKVLAPLSSPPECCDTTVSQAGGDTLRVVTRAAAPEKCGEVATVIKMPMTHNIEVDSKL